jgi:hypothetical protein
MNSSCIAGCLDAQTPVKLSFVKLCQWVKAEASLLKRVSMNEKRETTGPSPLNFKSHPVYHGSYASNPRQRYLRSYTFCRKETVAEKTKKWLKETTKKNTESKSRSGSSGSCSFLEGVFIKFLFLCVAEVDVHEH